MNDVCEIRVPIYKRPDLLLRAWQGLLGQNHENWPAVILGDHEDCEIEGLMAGGAD